ncbi:hypothetical protein T492DRAFT_852976 [Pavlovales sp. CCMP2436]|nr:hypothetical protein T492DRAFT_852976 [Pavlovales sp. CCMP2436]
MASPCERCDDSASFRCFAVESPACDARRGLGAVGVSWCHVSCLEHCCSDCLSGALKARPKGGGGKGGTGAREAAARRTLVERHLPNWAQCNACAKWRRVSPSAEPWADDWPASWECRDSSSRGSSCLTPADPLLRQLATRDDAEREGEELLHLVHPSVASHEQVGGCVGK